jgi:hypothetical protein
MRAADREAPTKAAPENGAQASAHVSQRVVEPDVTAWLTPDEQRLVDAIAHRVAELLEQRDERDRFTRLVDAETLAGLLGVSRSTVYEHAVELGAVEVGNGSKPRLRFDVEQARAAWTRKAAAAGAADETRPPMRAPRRRRSRSEDALLPVRTGSARG